MQFGLSIRQTLVRYCSGIAMVTVVRIRQSCQIEPDFEADENYIQGQVYTRKGIFAVSIWWSCSFRIVAGRRSSER
ncbi:MAG: hypothetical protein ACLUD0_10625 [Eubacterium ramulus]